MLHVACQTSTVNFSSVPKKELVNEWVTQTTQRKSNDQQLDQVTYGLN